MKRSWRDAQSELVDFLDSYAIGGSNKHSAYVKRVYRKLNGILTICHMVENQSEWNGDKQDNFRVYYRETASDLLQSILLAAQGLYKTSYFSSRSAIENFFRCIGIAQDQSVLSLTSTYELINAVKDTPIISGGGLQKSHFHTLHAEYVAQCNFVHTASAAHMSLTTIVGAYPRYIENDANQFFLSYAKTISSIVCISAILLPSSLKEIHHMHSDYILDALPKSVKRQINL